MMYSTTARLMPHPAPNMRAVVSSLSQSANHAETLGLLQPVSLKGIFDLTSLNQVLRSRGQPTVPAS